MQDETRRQTDLDKKAIFTRILAGTGDVLVWLPIVAPILVSVMAFFTAQRFLFDYLMPAEFFPLALAGGALLIWAARRAHRHLQVICWGLGLAVVSLVGGQVLALVTGLTSGKTGPGGWSWIMLLASLAIYSAGAIIMGIGGAALLVDPSKMNKVSPKKDA